MQDQALSLLCDVRWSLVLSRTSLSDRTSPALPRPRTASPLDEQRIYRSAAEHPKRQLVQISPLIKGSASVTLGVHSNIWKGSPCSSVEGDRSKGELRELGESIYLDQQKFSLC